MATSSCSVAPVQSELKMTLYNKEVYAGRGTNGVTTLVNGGPIGTTWVFSWPVTDGPAGGADADANVVGHLQGTGVQVATYPDYMWHYSLGLVFGQKSSYPLTQEKVLDSSSKPPVHMAGSGRPNAPPYPLPVLPMDDDEISSKAIGGPTGEILETNSQILSQISTNLSNMQLMKDLVMRSFMVPISGLLSQWWNDSAGKRKNDLDPGDEK